VIYRKKTKQASGIKMAERSNYFGLVQIFPVITSQQKPGTHNLMD